MELIKIGKYIASKRKELGMTQRQVAEKLGMSDKSVSKWERGVCLPDASVYLDLCQILGISINEFFAGEDVSQENMVKKSEENIIGVVRDSKHKQTRLARIIGVLLVILLVTLAVIGIMLYQSNKPQNNITPVDRESVEMKTAEILSGPDGAFVYKYTTTDEYSSLKIYVSEYKSGVLVNKENFQIGYDGIGSPKNGNIYITPDFNDFMVKLIVVDESSKLSTEFPILANVPDREYYGRSATEIQQATDIRYNEEQALVALIYDNDEMRVLDLQDMMYGETDALAMNDYVYYFSFEFCKEKKSNLSG